TARGGLRNSTSPRVNRLVRKCSSMARHCRCERPPVGDGSPGRADNLVGLPESIVGPGRAFILPPACGRDLTTTASRRRVVGLPHRYAVVSHASHETPGSLHEPGVSWPGAGSLSHAP